VTTTGDHWKRQYNLTILLSLHQVFCTKCNKKYHRFCCQAHYAKIKFWIKLTFKVCVKSLPARPGSHIKPCPQEKHFIDKNYEFALQLLTRTYNKRLIICAQHDGLILNAYCKYQRKINCLYLIYFATSNIKQNTKAVLNSGKIR